MTKFKKAIGLFVTILLGLFLPMLGQALYAQDSFGSTTMVAVAAENFYGDVIKQIAGPFLAVTTVLDQPNQDPHSFEANTATARKLAQARLVVYNAAAYDLWIEKLLSVTHAPKQTRIGVAELLGKKAGDNPHIWYLPSTMAALAKSVHGFLSEVDPAHRQNYDARLIRFLASLKPFNEKIAALRARYYGLPVAATEPIFNEVAQAIGLKILHMRFQYAIMNGTEPSAKDIAAFLDDLDKQHIKLLIDNAQTTHALTQRLRKGANQANIPIFRVTEMLPIGMTYQQWMHSLLDELSQALAHAS